MTRAARGFTLVEVLVALAITAIALVAGLKATAALTDNAGRDLVATAELASAASVPASSPKRYSKARFCGASGCSAGSSGFR